MKKNQSEKDNAVYARQPAFFKSFVQPKLSINSPNDMYEQEADAVADRVMRMPDASINNNNSFFKPAIISIQRKCAHCEEEEKKMQRKEENGNGHAANASTENYIGTLNGKGKSLTQSERSFFEPRMGYDFSNVQLHTNAEANQSAKDINALAYTHGNHIVFGSGRYQPGTESGKRLMAHELTHVVQQDKNIQAKKIQRVTDADVESGTGVDQGITNGTMVQDGIMGQSFNISCGFKNYTASFKFAKAYKGTYPYKAGGRDVKGVYVKIEMSITDNRYCGRCTPMLALQVLRNTKKNSTGNLEAQDPQDATRRERSGWGNASAPSRGWRVDTLTTSVNPYYSSTWVGQEGSETTPAIIWDTPGDWSTDKDIGKDFNSSIICQNAAGGRWPVGYVHWGYYINSSGDIAFEPATPDAACGYSTQTKDASERWDNIAGNTKTGITY
ncbi:DUF4157 domain-containing protein [Parafilimonas sp.]|uniref:eCIS core domain-containing protein n=1 Tax=Parafilimonas sp. TaxID=1969739 RepID=UPI0039E5D4C9